MSFAMDQSADVEAIKQEDVVDAFYDAQTMLESALRQIAYLDLEIANMRKLYRRAENNNVYAIRNNLRMQLTIVSGVKMMYHHYAAVKANRVNRLRLRIDGPVTPRPPPPQADIHDESISMALRETL